MSNKGINITFPIQDDVVNNFFLDRSRITKDAIKSNLLLLLLTNVGERYYMPDYGMNLYKYLFEQNDPIIEEQIIGEIKNRVSIYIPEIQINNINIENDENKHSLVLIINFTYNQNTFSDTDTITIVI